GGGCMVPLMLHRWPNSLQRNDHSGPRGSLISFWLVSMSSESSGTEQSSSLVTSTTASVASSRKKPTFVSGGLDGSSAQRTDLSCPSNPQPVSPSAAIHPKASLMSPS